jgi:outer membrane protein assembly factor BamB
LIKMKHFIHCCLLILFTISCNFTSGNFNPDIHIEEVWSRDFTGIGIHSSPRATDLNGDGIKDLIFGTGKLEMMETDVGIVALSGATGETLWKLPAHDQVFGSATLLDITGDGVKDVIINGRAALLMAIEGRTGEIIWEFLPETSYQHAKDQGLFNFYNAQLIPDQTGNGLPDLLVANGGDFTVPPYDPDRPTGKLMIISSATGELISEADVPDGRETYMSAVVAKLNNHVDDYTIIYGTGGETIGGNLYRVRLSDLLKGNLEESIVLATGEDKGFIAPPVLADLNSDGFLDIAVNSVDGRILAFSGRDNSPLWKIEIDNRETYGSITPGHFIDQNRIDLYTTLSIGVWPDLRENEHFLINGETGEILMRDTLGVFQTATPVAADFTNSGYDDALISVNIGYEQFDGSYHYRHILVVHDFQTNLQYILDELQPGANLASTPWVGDLDGNGKLDIIYSVLGDSENIFTMNGFKMHRLRSHMNLSKNVVWGSYMGSNHNGIFQQE